MCDLRGYFSVAQAVGLQESVDKRGVVTTRLRLFCITNRTLEPLCC
jgi:hypothetical protein